MRKGDLRAAFAKATTVVERTLSFGRHTGVTLEPRGLIADFDPTVRTLSVHTAHQSPWQQQDVFSRLFGIDEHDVRIITPDIGGAFGLKLQVYGDEVAAVAISVLIGRPVKFVADRLESFVTDIHDRDHRVNARIGMTNDGRIQAIEIDDLTGVGPYSMYPRTSAIEANQIVNMVGGPYAFDNYKARATVVYLNKNMMCQYRAVGHPVMCAVTEGLVDSGARAIGMDPAEVRRINVYRDCLLYTSDAADE